MRTLSIACLATCLLLPLFSLAAQPATASSEPSVMLLAQNDELSLNEATRMVQQRTGGRVLSANEVRRNGNRWYEIRVLVAEGKVRVFRVDPATGRTR